MMTKKFQRTKEDFTCEKCGLVVKGSGYTNHCSRCLWSKHVDVNPGDRQTTCQGFMEPVGVELKGENTPFSTGVSHAALKSGTRRRKTTVSTPFSNSQAVQPNGSNTKKEQVQWKRSPVPVHRCR